ncbi:PAS domain S-box protein [Sesbania bispinosa]|nr:PAS domain S-box protein [Sesbania bispinosa]
MTTSCSAQQLKCRTIPAPSPVLIVRPQRRRAPQSLRFQLRATPRLRFCRPAPSPAAPPSSHNPFLSQVEVEVVFSAGISWPR